MITQTRPDNLTDVIDSRDVIEAIEALNLLVDNDTSLTDSETEELAALVALHDEGSDSISDWSYGEQLIRDSYFEEYAQQLAEEIGAIDDNAVWPQTCIDWEQAARELRYDYTSLDFDGITYWARP